MWRRAKPLNANNAIQSKKASCYSPHQRSTRHDAHAGIHTLALGDQMTPITSTQCHGNSTPRTHPDGNTASHGTRSRTKRCPHHTHHTQHTHLRPALASTLEPSLVPLETCHPAQGTRIVDGLTNATPVTPSHTYSKCRVRTSSFASTSAPAEINCTAASDSPPSTAA